MDILIINQHKDDALGGSEIQCHLNAKYLTEFGHNVIYYAVDGQKEEYQTEYSVVPRPLNNRYLSKLLQKHKPDITYWRYNTNKLFHSARLINKYDTNLVFAVSSVGDVKKWNWNFNLSFDNSFDFIKSICSHIYNPLSNRFNYLGYQYVDAVTCLNSDYLDKINVNNQIRIPNSFEISADKFEWGSPFVAWVANIKPIKNPEKFIELSKEFQRENIDFLMIGHLQSNEYSYINNSDNLPENCFYLGPKTPAEVNGILQESLFLVHTCDPEGFGNIFIQAWLQEKPTVSLYFDPESIITDKDLGFVSGDFSQLVTDTQILIENEQLRDEIGARAKHFAQSEFSPETNIRELESFFYKLIEDD